MRVGIDLGTTTSTICRVTHDGRIDTQGPIPSIAAWKNGEWSFGETAERLLASADRAAYPVRDLKLSLGKKAIRVGPNPVDTEEAVAGLFRHLAGRIAGKEAIEEAVIGTPVNVDLDHRKALLNAAALAGFKHVRLVYEPTSALVGAIEPSALDAKSLVLVVDWGGGTLDVAVVRKDRDVIREIEVDGDVKELGGSRMDDEIAREVLGRNAELRQKVDAVDGGFDRLKQEIEGAKREILSDGTEDESAEPYPIPSLWLHEEIQVRPADVFNVVRKMAARGREKVITFLEKGRIAPSEITHILFAGGVCNSPIVQEALAAEFRNARIISTKQQPQLLTGYGCARLLKADFSLQLSAAFGVRQADETFCEMLPEGHDLAVGTFRVAEFMVTDVLADEAVFDLGIRRHINGETSMKSSSSDSFRAMDQLFLRAQDSAGKNKCNSGDLVRLFCGIDSTLAVTVYGESNLTGCSATKAVSGLPLCIRANV